MTSGRVVGLAIAVMMVVIGAVWTFQGLGYLKGSPMTGEPFWAQVGAPLAGLGVALAIVVLRPRR